MQFVLDLKKQKGEQLPDWYEKGIPCGDNAMAMALAWYSRAKTLRTSGFDGVIIDELRLEEFGRKRLGLGDRVIELFIRVVNEMAYVENAFSKDASWEYGEPIPQEKVDDGDSKP